MSFAITEWNLNPNQNWYVKISDSGSDILVELYESEDDLTAGTGLTASGSVDYGTDEGAVAVWMWQDYQGLRDKNATQAAQIDQVVSTHNIEMERAHRVREQLQAAIDLQVGIATKRMESNKKLSRQIASLQKLERPDHEKNCAVHPGIVFAFDQLRSGNENSKAD
jgi:hypothetical protein